MTRLLTQTDVQLFAMYHRYHYNSDIRAKKKKKTPQKSLYYTGLCVRTSTAKYRVPSRRSGAHMKTRPISHSHVAFGLLTPASQGHGDFRASRGSEKRTETITEQTCFILAPYTKRHKVILVNSSSNHITFSKKCLQKSYRSNPRPNFGIHTWTKTDVRTLASVVMDWMVPFPANVSFYLSGLCSDPTLLHPSSLGHGPAEPRRSPASVPDWLCPFPTDRWSGDQQRNGYQLPYFPASGGPAGSHQHACPAQHPVLLPTFLHLPGICHGAPSFLPVWPVQSEQGTSETVNFLCVFAAISRCWFCVFELLLSITD